MLINGTPSTFFLASPGLLQGCIMSPLLLLIFIEGLILMVKQAKVDCDIRGVKVSKHIFILHFLFVDNVLIFCDGIVS